MAKNLQDHQWSSEDIFNLAQTNPIVCTALQYWKRDYLTWEQTLIIAVCLLAEQNGRLLDTAVQNSLLQ